MIAVLLASFIEPGNRVQRPEAQGPPAPLPSWTLLPHLSLEYHKVTLASWAPLGIGRIFNLRIEQSPGHLLVPGRQPVSLCFGKMLSIGPKQTSPEQDFVGAAGEGRGQGGEGRGGENCRTPGLPSRPLERTNNRRPDCK